MVVTLLRDDTAGRTVARMPGANADTAATPERSKIERTDTMFNLEIATRP
jgi:hypothetical protein|tara:strand:+ start:308 stop:457 length:150 start_codon:yes stop_codon:yes gene_type:complete